MPNDSAQAGPARDHSVRPKLDLARATRGAGLILFALGAASAVLAAGLGWMLLEPPLPARGGLVRAPLVATLLVYSAPLALMTAGTVRSFADPYGPRLLLCAVTFIAAVLFAPVLSDTALDLAAGRTLEPAVVLGHYDCDRLDARGRAAERLDCVELAWRRPDGQTSRDRFLVGDVLTSALPLERGQCVMVWVWARSERLVALHPAPAGACEPRANESSR